MATLGNTYLTLADKFKRSDPDNSIAAIIEILAETNDILLDAITMEGNLPTGHRTTVRTGYPTATWRQLYQGVVPGKSTTKQVDDQCGMLEQYSEVDKALADLNGNTSAFRLSEATAFIESMNQAMADTLIDGNTAATPEKFMGLSPRYNALGTDATLSSFNVVDGGGTGSDNTSVYFVTWGDNSAFLTYPKGSMGGLQHEDKGQVTLGDATNGYFEGYRDHFKWDLGFVLRDWRGSARIANLDISLMAAGSVAIEDFMIDAYYKVRKTPGRKAIYCPEQVMVALHKRAKAQANVNLSLSNFEGREVVSFLGIPIRQVDAITIAEAQIT